MTIFGKILVFSIMVCSTVFMAFSVMTYSAHRNWKKAYSNASPQPGEERGMLEQRDDLQKSVDDLATQLSSLLRQKKAELDERDSDMAKLETERMNLSAENKKLQADKDALTASEREAVATMKTLQDQNAAIVKELQAAREELIAVHRARDQHMGEVVRLTDEVNQAHGELERLKARETQLGEQIVSQQQLIAYHGLTEHTPDNVQRPPKVEGRIVALNNSEKLVEISIGSDDGILPGHELEVYRLGSNPRYLGRVRVTKTAQDRAVAKVVDGTMKGPFERNDYVATQLR